MYFVDLPGGLGNQIFAYFAGLYLAENSDTKVYLQSATTSKAHVGNRFDLRSFDLHVAPLRTKLPESALSPIYYPEKNGFSRRIGKMFNFSNIIHFETGADSRKDLDTFLSSSQFSILPKRVSGYFGDFAIYDHIKEQVRELRLRKRSSKYTALKDFYQKVPCIGIHLRAGDFLNMKETVGVLDDDFYLESLEQALRAAPRSSLLVFSNDEVHARKRVAGWKINNYEIISPQTLNDPAESLEMMSQCDYIITANSTFSFWAAKLSKRKKGVWIPKHWRRDGWPEIQNVPPDWVRTPNSWQN